MTNEYPQQSGFLGFVASSLNKTGSGLVDVFDMSEKSIEKIACTIKNKVPVLNKKDMYVESLDVITLCEKIIIESKIKKKRKKIEKLYYEIGMQRSEDTYNPSQIPRNERSKVQFF